MKRILFFLLGVFISVFLGITITEEVFLSENFETDVYVRAPDKKVDSPLTQKECPRFMEDLLKKNSFDTAFGETITDLFLESCPKEVQLFPFQEPIWVFTLKGVQSGHLILGYMVLEDNVYGRIKKFLNDRLVIEFSNKEIVSYTKRQGIFMPADRVIRIIHPAWQDFVLIEGDQIIRLSGDKGRIVQKTANEIAIKWKNYSVETFILKNDKWYLKE